MMKELKIKAEVANIEKITAFVDEYLESIDCPMKVQMQLDVVIDEIFSNIALYAYPNVPGEVTIQIDAVDSDTVKMTFEDDGKPYNPLLKEDPDITLSAEDREIGGLGIFMVKKMTDHIEYAFENGKNVLTVHKHMAPAAGAK